MDKRLGCLVLLSALVMAPLTYIVNGWVLSILWTWFVVPFGVPVLTVPYAIGISIIVGFLTHQHNTTTKGDGRKNEEELVIKALSSMLTAPLSSLIVLCVAWIVVQFV